MSPEEHFRAFLDSLGLDSEQDTELKETPRRVAELMADLLASSMLDPPKLSTFPATGDEPVLVQQIPFRSMCVHHMLPFFGTIDIAYIPGERLAGFGGFIRAVEYVSRKPQVQERLVEELAEILHVELEPKGVLVRCRARQMCVEMLRETPAHYVSIASRGDLKTGSTRDNFLAAFAMSDAKSL